MLVTGQSAAFCIEKDGVSWDGEMEMLIDVVTVALTVKVLNLRRA